MEDTTQTSPSPGVDTLFSYQKLKPACRNTNISKTYGCLIDLRYLFLLKLKKIMENRFFVRNVTKIGVLINFTTLNTNLNLFLLLVKELERYNSLSKFSCQRVDFRKTINLKFKAAYKPNSTIDFLEMFHINRPFYFLSYGITIVSEKKSPRTRCMIL